MTKFSLLCPSRGRINMLENLLSSIENTANNLDDIELLIVIDDDDLETREYIKDKYYPFRVKVFVRNRSEYFNRDYYNWLVQYSEGKYLWAIGNDVVFKVKDWDKILGEKIEEYLKDKPDRIVCIGPKDNTPPEKVDYPRIFASFPIITREAYNVLNIFLHPELKTWGADTALYELYSQINRYLFIDDKIYLEHISYFIGLKEKDEFDIRVIRLHESSNHVITYIVPEQAMKLRYHIWKYLLKSDISIRDNCKIIVAEGYRSILKREPSSYEIEHDTDQIFLGKLTKEGFLETIITNEEYKKTNIKTRKHRLVLREKPHVLVVTEKWCDYKQSIGPSNSEHNIIGSLETSDLATYEQFYFDEYYHQHNSSCDLALILRCIESKPDLLFYSRCYNGACCPKFETLGIIRELFGIPVAIIWWEAFDSPDSILQFVDLNVVLNSIYEKTNYPEKYITMWTPQDTRIYYNPNIHRDIDVSFVGSIESSHYTDRCSGIAALRSNNINVYQTGGQREHKLSVAEYANIYMRSKITINFCNSCNPNIVQAKGRIFEATLCGAMLLESYNVETNRWFSPGIDFVPFRNNEELVHKVKYYLGHDSEREKIAITGSQLAKERYNSKMFWINIFRKIFYEKNLQFQGRQQEIADKLKEDIKKFVVDRYRNILERDADHEEFERYTNHIYSGLMTKERLLGILETSKECRNKSNTIIKNEIPIIDCKNLVNNKICAIIALGRSLEELEKRIEEFKNFDIVWCGMNFFNPPEAILKKINKEFAVIFDAGMVENIEEFELNRRLPRLTEYLSRRTKNIYITLRVYLYEIRNRIAGDFNERFKEKILYGEDLKVDTIFRVSLPIYISCLHRLGAKKIILFGADGGGIHGNDLRSYYKSDLIVADKSIVKCSSADGSHLGSKGEDHMTGDTNVVNTDYDSSMLQTFGYIPDIINCSPGSNYKVFKNMSYDEIINWLKSVKG